MRRIGIIALVATATPLAGAAESIPAAEHEFLSRHCAVCHTGDQAQAEVRLDGSEIDWSTRRSTDLWERVHTALESEAMPPEGAVQPSGEARDRMVAWLDSQLMRHSGVGGVVPRRLNREEYANSIRDLFAMPGFALPNSFPSDDSLDGFDNVGEGLVLSPPLMAQYLTLATGIADELLPPDGGPVEVESKLYRIGPSGLSTSGTAHVDGGGFRLVSTRNNASAAGWPTRFEAVHSGTYRIVIHASVYQTDRMFYARRTEPLQMHVYARRKAEQTYDAFSDLRKLKEFEVEPSGETQVLTAEVELMRGEIFGIRWADGPAHSHPDKQDYSDKFLSDRLKRDRLYYAAMLEYKGGPRGTPQKEIYEATTALMRSGKLDLSDPRLDKMPEKFGGGLSNLPHNWIKAFVHEEMYRFGPALDVLSVEIEGPLRLIEDDITRARRLRTEKFLEAGPPGASKREHAEAVLPEFLPKAFRRPVSEAQVREYAELVGRYFDENPESTINDGLHLAVRRALVSPHFLYRGLRPGRLDDFDLASRLSYFLTSSPPDDRLITLASEGKLSQPEVLEQETDRLLSGPLSENFVRSFTGQWLATRLLEGIMPDPRLTFYYQQHRRAMIWETEMFFAEILRENLSIDNFIDAGFSYRNEDSNLFYGGDLVGKEMRRVAFAHGRRQGGILGLASVMMATANGVDTNPILRGVWLLDNVFGMSLPDPPSNIPAIAPDTSGTTLMRDQLAAHRANASCARCHNHIDPIGMVLENFDPIGRWRDHYPIYTKPPDGQETLTEQFYSSVGKGVINGPPVDAVGILADGTRMEDVTDLKRHLLERIDMFSRCLTEKLMVYGTGRPLSYGDGRVADEIVAMTAEQGNGFRDLVVNVVQSEAFNTR